VEKWIFKRNLRLSRKWYDIGPWLLRKINRKSYVADRAVSVVMALSDLERGHIFQADLLNNGRTVWSRTTKFGNRTHVRRGTFLRGQPHPHCKEGCAPCSAVQFLGFPYISAYILLRRTTKFDAVAHGERACFYRVRHAHIPMAVDPQQPALPNFGGSLIFMCTPFVLELPNLTW